MSKITATEVRNMMGAYNAVYAPQQEEQEVQELALEIIENAAYVLFSQGYDVEDVISYFTEATEEVISEDFVNFAEGNVILESVAVSDEYIEEQFEVLNEGLLDAGARFGAKALGALRGGAGRVLAAGAKQIQQGGGGLRSAAGAMTRAATRAASQAGSKLLSKGATAAKSLMSKAGGALSKVGKVGGVLSKVPGGKLLGRIAPGAGVALGAMDAANRAKRGDWGGAALSGLGGALSAVPGGGTLAGLGVAGIQAATDAAGLTGDKSKKAPSAKTAPSADKAKFNASAALGGKTAFAAGGGAAAMKKDPKLTAADIQKRGTEALFKAGGGKSAEVQKGQTRAQVIAQGSKNVAPKPTVPAKPTPAAAAPEVKATNTIAAKPTQPAVAPAKPKTEPAAKPAGQSTMSQQAAELRDMQRASQLRQQGQDVTGANITSVRKDVEKFNKPEELNKPAPAGTALAAEQERRRKAQQAQQAKPVEESYDAYDLVLEYLFDTEQAETLKEAHYLMTEMNSEMIQSIVEAKRKSYSAKKARKGEDLGLPGKGFGKIAKEAGERYGSEERGEKVAGAVLKGLRAKHGK